MSVTTSSGLSTSTSVLGHFGPRTEVHIYFGPQSLQSSVIQVFFWRTEVTVSSGHDWWPKSVSQINKKLKEKDYWKVLLTLIMPVVLLRQLMPDSFDIFQMHNYLLTDNV